MLSMFIFNDFTAFPHLQPWERLNWRKYMKGFVIKSFAQLPNPLRPSNFQGRIGAGIRRKEKTTSLHSQTQSPGRGSEEENLQLCKCQGFYKEGTHSLLISHPKEIYSRTRIKQTKFRLQAQHLNLFSSAKTELSLMPNQSQKWH